MTLFQLCNETIHSAPSDLGSCTRQGCFRCCNSHFRR